MQLSIGQYYIACIDLRLIEDKPNLGGILYTSISFGHAMQLINSDSKQVIKNTESK